ncbi:16S rRNA (cytosine(1402)-N(4))-methyltransferase [Candidatus Kaiserbacteria bacterium CG10_big_fil_rev_8_21_14_0_10_51_14]|uniref:Ribosomal RNA small subunit methyltransferase H n=1 Tax=Candidatus Kaiserbacteria bacterium CG10_big_fil_rev_8_21_14_0_10_51_14 TaxID=1974610 RepID=A0A2H0UCF6_9BACT|nr:MAG: 16S rRNA (cytosine(1402)-N(4))-methyltransferase [Candidatus Kaiserbacteria bacterium CG10_big_fil_rev_8_21_14_0_10_51_14]
MRTRRFQFSSNPVSRPGPSAELRVEHQSVLLHEAIAGLAIEKDDTVVDATLGGAGHARAIVEVLGKKGTLVGFDVDHDAIERAEKSLAGVTPNVHLIEENFRNLGNELPQRRIKRIDKALFDLGWSSYQMAAERGFSFRSEEPLLMTFAKEAKPDALTAAKIVNEWGEESLADVIYGWGEERYSRRIAKAIVERRKEQPYTSAHDLAETIYAAVPARYRFGRIHPATRTFQALRIAVNDELGALEEGLKAAWEMLKPEGRIAVITFHSIEDRIVKQIFKQWEEEETGVRMTKKPQVASDEETAKNPRSRSAKLRIISKN